MITKNSAKKKKHDKWDAYKLCKLAKYEFCPYCHACATDTKEPEKNKKGYRPNIDHFYPKAEYPFLALTLGNFIPCCEKCNGPQMKGTTDFSKQIHLNPLSDCESISFSLEPRQQALANKAELLALAASAENYLLNLKIQCNVPESILSLQTFQLVDRYQLYLDEAYYLARRLRSALTRIEMQNQALNFDVTLEDNLGFNPNNYKNKLLGKMKLDIAKQYGIISDTPYQL